MICMRRFPGPYLFLLQHDKIGIYKCYTNKFLHIFKIWALKHQDLKLPPHECEPSLWSIINCRINEIYNWPLQASTFTQEFGSLKSWCQLLFYPTWGMVRYLGLKIYRNWVKIIFIICRNVDFEACAEL